MVSFSQLPAVKKDTIFGAVRKIYDPSYFVMALGHINFLKHGKRAYSIKGEFWTVLMK
jgi:hypothetical protein